MTGLWLGDIEALEAIAQDTTTRELVLRMATMSASGSLGPFIADLLAADAGDAEIACMLAELAYDHTFLHAVEDYVHRTHVRH